MRSRCEDDSAAIEGLAEWLNTAVGREVARVEREVVDRMIENSFGHFLVQIGCLGDFHDAFEHSRIRSHVVLSERSCVSWGGSPLRAKPAELPLAPASIDALLLPHTLDFALQPQRVLREAERVLIPEGRILIIGFNPLSTWGLMRRAPHHRQPPWCGNQLTSSRLIDWLDLLGFQLEVREWLLFRPPLRSAFSSRLDWIEETGARWWPIFGGIYVMRAVKRVTLSTPLRPRWRQRSAFLPGGAVKPTARQGNHARQ
ncbi:methyltransferase domain-containing protein [Lamprobacter modestohalophilus]|uniref:class I SAM-dependent methyltransferase n=1 Tax=Lamprobacter modestohalophilus TaxID=1064514 RepID=UPI002ADEB413|nr:methyltransferase domain-containing protein [Lamprobacter modestohalophilus]MEA1052000.1 methyltransferase domain-containing protein [Lamprobacter modestohalophilus]